MRSRLIGAIAATVWVATVWVATVWAATVWVACGDGDPGDPAGPGESGAAARPSLLWVVLDTTRRDAVSAYGSVAGTTPYLDGLAGEGVRYEWALAPAPWTLPSHATLFTALGPDRHGVGVRGRMVLSDREPTLAERLAEAGYETIGFSENPIVGSAVGLTRGFQHFEGESDAVAVRSQVDASSRFDVVLGVQRWAAARDGARPFFAFVNLFDPHDPYVLREAHLHLPAGTDLEEARRIGRGDPLRGVAEAMGICDRLPAPRELAILRGLYLGEVAQADGKLARIHRALAEAAPGGLVTVVTSDHGEHLGEHRLLGHEFSLHAELLRVPLIVHGLPGVAPAVVERGVGLGDLAPSALAWLGVAPPEGWRTAAIPLTPGGDGPTEWSHHAFYGDAALVAPEGMRTDHAEQIGRRRRGCRPGDGVFGEIAALLRFPYKLIRYRDVPPRLYDLRWDASELSDVSGHHPALVEEMSRELAAWRERAERTAAGLPAAPLPDESIESLRALGYLE